MDEKVLYILLGLAYLVFQYFGNLKKKQREAEKKHPPPPRRVAPGEFSEPAAEEEPPMLTLEEILQRAADESRRAKEARQAAQEQREREQRQRKLREQQRSRPVQPQRTWVTEKPEQTRKQTSPFLTTDAVDYRAPQMETYSTLEGASLETIGDEGGVSLSSVSNPVVVEQQEDVKPAINLRQAMLHQVILQRPEY